jgi:hypothetical protein
MLGTIFRFTTSSRSSALVQCVIGRADFSGGSQANTKICVTCSAVNVPGQPDRGATRNVSRIASRSREASAHSNCVNSFQPTCHRRRQVPTAWRPTETSIAIS